MGRALRAEQFSADEISIVHVTQRCVRRAFLTGVDARSGRDYRHRREWIRRRLEALASVYGIDVLCYAIMSNHFHLVLRNRPDVVAQWTDKEVATRWLSIFPGRRLDEKLASPSPNDVESLMRDSARIACIRKRLSDLSWFMRSVSEPIARMANRQDDCTGRFWEGRFKAQRIADEAGLLSCALYVDLNPNRAAGGGPAEPARYTSAHDRLHGDTGQSPERSEKSNEEFGGAEATEMMATRPLRSRGPREKEDADESCSEKVSQDGWLAPLQIQQHDGLEDAMVSQTGLRASDRGFLHLSQSDYLQLWRWMAQSEEKGAPPPVPDPVRNLASQLGIELMMWRDLVWNFRQLFGASSCAGSPGAMAVDAHARGRRWARGGKAASLHFAA